MDPQPSDDRVDELTGRAIRLNDADRQAFLQSECAGDPGLQGLVEQRLQDARSSTDSFEIALPALITPPSPGMQVGPFRIEQLIGTGGMGEVWRGHDVRLRRPVAIKICGTSFDHRFRREALAIAALNHPHICTLYDIGPNYLVMEFVEGEPVTGPLSASRAVSLGVELADALTAAHGRGVIHRDLKPANILVTKSGVKLLDFGVAKMTVGEGEKTQTGTASGLVVGSVGYMSPEQACGLDIDARSDIFAFGVVLYQMLVGRHPFLAVTAAETLAAIIRDEPPTPDVAPGLAAVLMRCLRKEPRERFSTAAELRDALRDVLHVETRTERPSVVVLPFHQIGGDAANEYFSEGLAEEVINVLARVDGLTVIARTSAFAFKNRDEDVRQIGRILGVAHVLEGSVRRAGNRVRVTAHLVDVRNGGHVWADRFDRDLTDIFQIQDDIAQAIADALRVKLTIPAIRSAERHQTRSLEAYEANLEGRFHLFQWTPSAIELARECFERAVRIDPGYAMPYAGLAEYYYYRGAYLGVRPREVLPAALEAARDAVSAHPDSAEAHMIRGVLRATYLYDWAGGKDDFDRAIALNPESAMPFVRRGFYFSCLRGDYSSALTDIRKGMQLDPLNPTVWGTEGIILNLSGRPAEALPRQKMLTEIHPSYWVGWSHLGWSLFASGDLDAAELALRHALTLHAQPAYEGMLGYVLGQKGARDEADGLRASLERRAAGEFVSPAALALAAIGCGDDQRAFHWLERGLEERELTTLILLQGTLTPEFRPDPRMRALRLKAGLV